MASAVRRATPARVITIGQAIAMTGTRRKRNVIIGQAIVPPASSEAVTLPRHLSPAQNDRLRAAMKRFLKENPAINETEFAGLLGIKQPSVSRFLNVKGGAAFSTAVSFAKIVKRKVDDIIGPIGWIDGEAVPGVTSPTEMRIGTFTIGIERRELQPMLDNNPGRWSVQTVMKLVEETDHETVPPGGWFAALDAIESGAASRRPDGDLRSDTEDQLGPKPLKPRKPR